MNLREFVGRYQRNAFLAGSLLGYLLGLVQHPLAQRLGLYLSLIVTGLLLPFVCLLIGGAVDWLFPLPQSHDHHPPEATQ